MPDTNYASAPAWSADGQSLAYFRLGDPVGSRLTAHNPANQQTQLYAAALATGRTRLVIPTKVDDARMNPQGTRLAYAYAPSIDLPTRQHRAPADVGELWSYWS